MKQRMRREFAELTFDLVESHSISKSRSVIPLLGNSKTMPRFDALSSSASTSKTSGFTSRAPARKTSEREMVPEMVLVALSRGVRAFDARVVGVVVLPLVQLVEPRRAQNAVHDVDFLRNGRAG